MPPLKHVAKILKIYKRTKNFKVYYLNKSESLFVHLLGTHLVAHGVVIIPAVTFDE